MRQPRLPLRAARAGCFIGGGTGLRYAYIDLALLDVERGVGGGGPDSAEPLMG